MDDFTLAGKCNAAAVEVQMITDAFKQTGLHLNQTKCEIIADDLNQISHLAIFEDFKRVATEDMTLLGVPILMVRQ